MIQHNYNKNFLFNCPFNFQLVQYLGCHENDPMVSRKIKTFSVVAVNLQFDILTQHNDFAYIENVYNGAQVITIVR